MIHKINLTTTSKSKLENLNWWQIPIGVFGITCFVFLTYLVTFQIIAKTIEYQSPSAKPSEIQALLQATSRQVLAAEVSNKTTSWLIFNPVATEVYVAAVDTSSTPPVTGTGNASGQVFYGGGGANNKFGMYVQNTTDQIAAASTLVNSNGGDWGYVLLTMNLNDRGSGNWQSLLNAAGNNHVKPIIQLFNAGSCNPDEMDFDGLAEMLNGLTWPTSRRYISIFNEVNAGDYWCGNASGEEYAKALDKAITALKGQSSAFFVMPAAMNSSARHGAVSNEKAAYIGEEYFLAQMNTAVPGIFGKIDGWATHAYPQPNFSGGIASGRDSILNYRWELGLLASYGAGSLPVFITETGWLHREGQESCGQYSQAGLLSAETVAARYKAAFVNYWLPDNRVVAIAPFIWASNDPCAAGFAWAKADGSLYPQGEMLKAIPKTAGTP